LGTKNNKKESSLTEAGFAIFSEAIETLNLNGTQKRNLKAKYDYWQQTKTTKQGKLR